MDFSKIALSGILGGSLAFGGLTGCTGGDSTAPSPTAQEFSEIHSCRGLNACKGLGGCSMSKEQLAAAATKLGKDKVADEPHDCAGKNSCKGLGGCKVDADKLAQLKAKLKG